MQDLRAHVANCLIGGESITDLGGGAFIRDTVRFTCEGREFILTQKPEVINNAVSEFTGSFSRTTQILVPKVSKSAVPEVLATIDRICWLLSFACQSKVVCYGHDYPAETPGSRHAVVGIARFFRPVFEIRDGAVIRDFIDQTYSAYTKLEKSRKLRVAIDYQLQAEQELLPTECRLIFAFVLLENLKHTYAHEQGIPFSKGRFRTASDRAISFRDLLARMLKAVGMKVDDARLKAIVALRNDIVHSGVSALSQRDQRAVYDEVQDIVREYFLRLLGFKGSYGLYSTACASQAVIP